MMVEEAGDVLVPGSRESLLSMPALVIVLGSCCSPSHDLCMAEFEVLRGHRSFSDDRPRTVATGIKDAASGRSMRPCHVKMPYAPILAQSQ
jgi:hypothetical protein